jgi:hypothetical protein
MKSLGTASTCACYLPPLKDLQIEENIFYGHLNPVNLWSFVFVVNLVIAFWLTQHNLL